MKFVSVAFSVLLAPVLAGAQDVLDCHFVPGWERAGPARQYSPDNLFDYRDGAAEGYLQFGFARMQGRDCKSGANTLAIDISEMADAEMAYGMFSANRDPNLPIAKIGMGAQVQPQSLVFSRGNFYVELVVTDAPPEANFTGALQSFADKINARLPGSDTPPQILNAFPKENLSEARLIPESVLGLRLLTRGYVARYSQGQAFIVQEATPEAASALVQRLREHFAGANSTNVGDEAIQATAPYLEGICIFRKGRFVAGFANLPDGEQACARASQLAFRISDVAQK